MVAAAPTPPHRRRDGTAGEPLATIRNRAIEGLVQERAVRDEGAEDGDHAEVAGIRLAFIPQRKKSDPPPCVVAESHD